MAWDARLRRSRAYMRSVALEGALVVGDVDGGVPYAGAGGSLVAR